MNLKEKVESVLFEKTILAVIFLNSVIMGIETNDSLSEFSIQLIKTLDNLCLVVFVLEIALKFLVYKNRFFHDPWRVFDFIIVAASLIPSSGPFVILRVFRVLKALRVLSVSSSLKKVVSGLLSALPGLGAVISIMTLVFYVGSVLATQLFKESFPDWFGSVFKSAYSLFQVMTLESWSMGIVRPVMEKHPQAWLFFIPFIITTAFITLNMFIAVMVDALENAESEEDAFQRTEESKRERALILEELKKVRSELNSLKEK